MSGQRLGVGDGHAAQHHGIARAEAVDVEAERGARFHRRCLPEILGGGDLAVIVVALDHDNPETGALGDRGIVGERRGFVAPSGAAARCASSRAAYRKTCGVCARHKWARGTVSEMAPAGSDALQRVGERHAQDGAVDSRRRQGLQAGGDVGRPDEGAGGIVDGDQVRRLGGQRFQAVQHRMLPAGAAFDRRRQIEAGNGCPVVRFVAATDHDLDPVDPGGCPEDRQSAAQDRLPA